MEFPLYVVTVVFATMLVQSALGFGSGLVGIPLLVLQLPIEVASPLMVLLSITVGTIIVAQDWQHVHFRSVGLLLVSSLFGMPIGLLVLKLGSPHLLKAALAIFLIVFSSWSLWGGSRRHVRRDSSLGLCICGFLGGILGELFAMSGPPLIIYGATRGWSAQRFRATGQGYFLPVSIAIMIGYWIGGLWIRTVTSYYFWSLPAALIALVLGRHVNRWLHGRAFHQYLYVAIIGIGIVLMMQVIHDRPAEPAKDSAHHAPAAARIGLEFSAPLLPGGV